MAEISLRKLLLTRLLLIAQGHVAQDDADKLRHDPALAAAVADESGIGATSEPLPSQPSLSRFITSLECPENKAALGEALLDMAITAFRWRRDHRHRQVTLDLDSTDLAAHGQQQGATYNGHYEHACFHPLLAYIAETRDLVGIQLREGHVASQTSAKEFVMPLIGRINGAIGLKTAVRADSAFAVPDLMDALDAAKVPFIMALRANQALDDLAGPLIASHRTYTPMNQGSASDETVWAFELQYAAESWAEERRVVLVVVDRHASDRATGRPAAKQAVREKFLTESVPDWFYLVTNYSPSQMNKYSVLAHYRQRGTMEQSIGEFKRDLRPRLSSPAFETNEVNLLLFGLAYQWLHIARKLAFQADPQPSCPMLATFRAMVLKVAVRLRRHARQAIFDISAPAFDAWQRLLAWLDRRQTRLSSRSPAPSPPS